MLYTKSKVFLGILSVTAISAFSCKGNNTSPGANVASVEGNGTGNGGCSAKIEDRRYVKLPVDVRSKPDNVNNSALIYGGLLFQFSANFDAGTVNCSCSLSPNSVSLFPETRVSGNSGSWVYSQTPPASLEFANAAASVENQNYKVENSPCSSSGNLSGSDLEEANSKNLAAACQTHFNKCKAQAYQAALSSFRESSASKITASYSTDAPQSTYSGSGGGSCFLKGTQIAMADGSTKPIENMRAGDALRSFEPSTLAPSRSIVARNITTKVPGYYQLQVNNRVVNVTAEHPFYLGESATEIANMRGFRRVRDLQVGDTLTLRTKDGSLVKAPVQGIEYRDEPVEVYNVSNAFGFAPTFFADDIAVHNKNNADDISNWDELTIDQ